MKRAAVIVDVDGTLVDVRSIRHYVSGRYRNFGKFHAESVNCPPNINIVEQVREFHESDYDVLIVTARQERWRRHTSMWLAMNDVPSTIMYMRRNLDFRPDYQVKDEILSGIRYCWHVMHAIDDNPNVISLWKRWSIPVTVVPGWEDSE